ncbi:MAG TPA: PIN domain-containing protein [Bryobacteraceae bacterium]|nr:PIN domain-containing protein [Bryobacteraceae bacterium]
MSAPDFLDTNVLVYAYDLTDRRKQARAQELVRKALAGEMVLSTQVLGEFAATFLHKVSPGPKPAEVVAMLDALEPIRAIAPDPEIVNRAVAVHARYGLHFYDGMIIACAERAGSKRIWSEDLSDGHTYFGIRVENPFV